MVRNDLNETGSNSTKNSIPNSLEHNFCMYNCFSTNNFQQSKKEQTLQNPTRFICSQRNLKCVMELSVLRDWRRPGRFDRNDFHRSNNHSSHGSNVGKFSLSNSPTYSIPFVGRIRHFSHISDPEFEYLILNLTNLPSKV